MPTPTDDNAYLRCRIETILSRAARDAVQTATHELFRYLCENPRPAGATARGQCVIAIDDCNDDLLDILTSFLPAEFGFEGLQITAPAGFRKGKRANNLAVRHRE